MRLKVSVSRNLLIDLIYNSKPLKFFMDYIIEKKTLFIL